MQEIGVNTQLFWWIAGFMAGWFWTLILITVQEITDQNE